MRKLIIGRDQTSALAYWIPMSEDNYQASLTADTDTPILVPKGARIAVWNYSPGHDYFISDSVIMLPTSTTLESSNAMLNPPPLDVTDIETIHVRVPIAVYFGVSFYQ